MTLFVTTIVAICPAVHFKSNLIGLLKNSVGGTSFVNEDTATVIFSRVKDDDVKHLLPETGQSELPAPPIIPLDQPENTQPAGSFPAVCEAPPGL